MRTFKFSTVRAPWLNVQCQPLRDATHAFAVGRVAIKAVAALAIVVLEMARWRRCDGPGRRYCYDVGFAGFGHRSHLPSRQRSAASKRISSAQALQSSVCSWAQSWHSVLPQRTTVNRSVFQGRSRKCRLQISQWCFIAPPLPWRQHQRRPGLGLW